jgi:hypothetical protein
MNILNIHDYPPKEGGGVEINVYKTSEIMVGLGYSVTIATTRLTSETISKREDIDEIDTVKIVFIDSREKLHKLIDKADIVHIHFTFSCRDGSMWGLEYCAKTGKRCVISIMTNYEHIPFSALAKLTPLEQDEKLNLTTFRNILTMKTY